MRLFLARHGSTGKYVNCPNDKLTKQGLEEMEDMGRRFRENNIPSKEMAVVFGDSPRLIQSAYFFALGAYPGNIPVMEQIYCLNEKDYGEKFYEMPDSETKAKLADSSWLPSYEKDFVDKFGSETNEEVYIRAKDMHDKIIALYPDKNVVIVSSGGILAMIEFISKGLNFEQIQKLSVKEYSSAVLKRGEIKEVTRGPVVS